MNAGKRPPKPLEHQKAGTGFLRERTAAALFDEQGLGKTRQLIDAIAQDVEVGELDGALVICPNILKTTWGQEIEKFTAVRYAIFGSGRKARRETFRSLRAVFYVINYEAVVAEVVSLRALLRFKRLALVLDESHRIKTADAKVTKAVHSLRDDAAKRYIMTGTPVANKPEDLWSQIYFLDDGVALGATFESFKARYCTGAGGYTRIEDIRGLLAALSLRRQKEGTVDLPPKHVVRVAVPLAGRQLAMYDRMREELSLWVKSLSGDDVLAEAENILSRLIRLAQLASSPALLDASYDEMPAKFIALRGLVATYLVETEKKLIIWTSFVANIDAVAALFPELRPVGLHGAMDGAARDRSIHAFKSDPDVRLLVANPAAAREGLTLTEASTAIYLDRTFNLVDFLQSQDRIHRLSQRRACHVVLLLAQNTIDEFIDFSLAQKHRLARYTQGDADEIADTDLALQKPDLLRALITPAVG